MNQATKAKHKPLALMLVFLLVLGAFSPYLPGNDKANAYAYAVKVPVWDILRRL